MKKLVSRLHISDIAPPSRFLLLEELVGSYFSVVLSFPFHFLQFFSNFLKYSSSNLLLSHSYNIFTIYFSSNSPLLKSFSSTKLNFSCLLISAFILLLNSATNSLTFSKSSSFSQLLYFAINLFHCTKYFITPFIFFYLRFSLPPTL